MQIAKYNSLQNNYNKNTTSKYTNFKALNISPNIKYSVQAKYYSSINRLQRFKVFLENFKFWDLNVMAFDSEPIFILKSKKYKNEYQLIPEEIFDPLYLKDIDTSLIPCCMYIPLKNSSGFKENVVSNYDSPIKNRSHVLNLAYDGEKLGNSRYNKMCELYDKFMSCNNKHTDDEEFSFNFTNFPLFMLREFEESSLRKSKLEAELEKKDVKKAQDTEDSTESEDIEKTESFLVREADPEVINGTKSPSANGEIKGFAKVAGMSELKEILQEDVIFPLQNVELYKKYGITPANGILLYGPPGTGKTFIAEALAEESGRAFFKMSIAKTVSEYVGKTSKNIDNMFNEAAKKAPSIIFIDEVEGLSPSRNNLENKSSAAIGYNQSVSTLLENMNNCSERGIFVIAATNEPQKLDSAFRRSGRIEQNIFVGPPDFEARKELFRMNLEDIYSEKNIDYNKLASLTENYTAQEIKRNIIMQAAKCALKQNRRISENDLVAQIERYTPQLNSRVIEEYRQKGEINQNSANSRYKIGYIK